MSCLAETISRWCGIVVAPIWARGRVTPLRFDANQKLLVYTLGGRPKLEKCTKCKLEIYIIKQHDGVPVVPCGLITHEKNNS